MDAVVQISFPVFGLLLLGYFATRLHLFSLDHADGLTNFVHNFAVPLLLFRTLAGADLADTIPWRLVLGYYVPMLVFYAIGMGVARTVFKREFNAQVITGFAFSYGNAIQLGLPLALLLFNDNGTIAFFILIALHPLTAFTVTTILLEHDRSQGESVSHKMKGAVRGILTNPIILGILAGILFNRMAWHIPGPLDAIAGFMQQAVPACALFALGATLTRYGVAGRLQETTVVIVAKCIAFPLAVWLSCRYLFGIDPLWTMVATLLAAQPVGINVFIFAGIYRSGQALATTAVFLSTAFTLFSLPLLIYLIDLQGIR